EVPADGQWYRIVRSFVLTGGNTLSIAIGQAGAAGTVEIDAAKLEIVNANGGTPGFITPTKYEGADWRTQEIVRGALTLSSLTVTGALVINQDLTIGANVLFVDQSQSNVGINMAPDPQFDLDIAGNMRAGGYIVGKHAIQLPGALLIAHYDGPEPFET